MKEHKTLFDFFVFILLLPFVFCLYFRFKNSMTYSEIIEYAFFYSLLFLLLLIWAMLRKYSRLIKNAFLLDGGEKNLVISYTFALIIILPILGYIKTGSLYMIINGLYWAPFSLVEELVFRAFLLGMLIEKIPLSLPTKRLPLYLTENNKDILRIFKSITAVSILFSFYHFRWSDFLSLFLGGIMFSFVFVLTNKKIYVPWVVHFFSNVFYLS